ncbi:WD repeat domain phosphoinositide interacting protein, putative [Entamoeba histolytica KU27]|uniref:WD repeat domain phosphoinositide interacting protein, putative n=1 Tax=Entamoeba histolytica KU27 TaxID=885311 RepID=M2RMV0_ENTHI|nr:WD repeat domain phosphoinositide interacting protein, putative [Entamoeba histolytica KU27]
MEDLKVLSVSRSENGNLLAVGTTYGFIVFSIKNGEFTKRFHRTFRKGISVISVLEETNIVAFVGGGQTPYAPKNTLIVWDDKEGKEVMRKECENDITGIKITRNYLFIVFENMVSIMDLSSKTITNIDTDFNPKGILSFHSATNQLFIPSKTVGEVKVYQLGAQPVINSLKCHKHQITNLIINNSATVMASSSAEGIIIRLWEVKSGMKMKEFQRGSNPAEIINLSINNEQQYLMSYCSDYEISIFEMNGKVKGKSKWYTGGEQALASIKVESTSINAFFIRKDEIVVIDGRGIYQRYFIKEVDMY